MVLPPNASGEHAESPSSQHREPLYRRIGRASFSTMAGLLAGLVSFIGIVQAGWLIPLPDDVYPLLKKAQDVHLTPQEAEYVNSALVSQFYYNTMVQVAILGAAAGGLLGLWAGIMQRSAFASVAGLFGGAAAGAITGALGGAVDLFAIDRLWRHEFEAIFTTMLGHSAAFLIAAVAVGVVAGLAVHRVPKTLAVTLSAALIAGLIYPGLAAYPFRS